MSNQCKHGIETSTDESERGLYRSILYSVVRFETHFGQIEEDFWAYLEGYSDTAYYQDVAAAKGHDSFVEYLLDELGKCQSWVDEITTEVVGTGWEWSSVGKLTDEFWYLMDATEELFESGAEKHPRDEILGLIAKIPPQKLAPIQLEATSEFHLKAR